MSLRGHHDEQHTANFHCLMNPIGKFEPKVSKYMSSSAKFKFCSNDIQNELLKCISHSLLRDLIERIGNQSKGASLFLLRFFCNVPKYFRFYSTACTHSRTLLRLAKTSLMSFILPIVGIRGQGCDVAANTAGRENGLQAKISKAIYLYCFGHQFNLVVQETITTLRRRLVDETALKLMIPNMRALCVTYVCLQREHMRS